MGTRAKQVGAIIAGALLAITAVPDFLDGWARVVEETKAGGDMTAYQLYLYAKPFMSLIWTIGVPLAVFLYAKDWVKTWVGKEIARIDADRAAWQKLATDLQNTVASQDKLIAEQARLIDDLRRELKDRA